MQKELRAVLAVIKFYKSTYKKSLVSIGQNSAEMNVKTIVNITIKTPNRPLKRVRYRLRESDLSSFQERGL